MGIIMEDCMKLAIVGIFFDGYSDLWIDFVKLFRLNWCDCPYNLYIVNNELELDELKEYNVSFIHAGKNAEYSKKVRTAIEKIDAEYYLFLLDDFFFGEKILGDPLQEIIKYMNKESIMYYQMRISDFNNSKTKKYKELNQLRTPSSKDEYTVSCQPSIWKREFIDRCIGNRNYNAWIFEGIYCVSKYAHTRTFLQKCKIDYSSPLGLRHGAVQGKMLPDVIHHFEEMGYKFYSKRELLSGRAYKKYKTKRKINAILPGSVLKTLKKFAKSKSVYYKYIDEINKEMAILGIE